MGGGFLRFFSRESFIVKNNEFLKRDFPRVPIIENELIFHKYVTAGSRLRKLHLMQELCPAELKIEPASNEDLEIGAVKYRDGVLHLNPKKQIYGIPQDVWEYRIGGYQVLDKWMKSHKGERLNLERMAHIENVVGLLAETIKIRNGLRGCGGDGENDIEGG